MSTPVLAINPRLRQMLNVVVKRGHLRAVRNVQGLGVFVFAGGVRVGQGFLGEGGNARGLIA